MEQVTVGGMSSTNPTADTYNVLSGYQSYDSVEIDSTQIVSTGGIIKNLRVKLSAAPGDGKSWDITLMLNGNPTALTVNIAGAATSGADTTHEVDVVADDTISLKFAPTGTPTVANAFWTSVFSGSTDKQSLILGGVANEVSKTATEYNLVSGGYTWTATENNRREVIPTSGKIKNLYVQLSENPGVGADAYRLTLRVNGGSSSLTCTITAAAVKCNDTAHEVTVSPGDVVTLMCEPLETPANTPTLAWGMTFVADTDGESLLLNGCDDDLSNSATEYTLLNARRYSWNATEANRYQLGQTCTLKKLYVLLSGAPSTNDSYTFTVRVNGASPASGLVVLIEDSATTGNDTAHTVTVSDDDYLGMQCIPDSFPDVQDAYWGLVCYIAPPPSGWTGGDVNGVALAAMKNIKGVALTAIKAVSGVA